MRELGSLNESITMVLHEQVHTDIYLVRLCSVSCPKVAFHLMLFPILITCSHIFTLNITEGVVSNGKY